MPEFIGLQRRACISSLFHVAAQRIRRLKRIISVAPLPYHFILNCFWARIIKMKCETVSQQAICTLKTTKRYGKLSSSWKKEINVCGNNYFDRIQPLKLWSTNEILSCGTCGFHNNKPISRKNALNFQHTLHYQSIYRVLFYYWRPSF